MSGSREMPAGGMMAALEREGERPIAAGSLSLEG